MSTIMGRCNTAEKPVNTDDLNAMLAKMDHGYADDRRIWMDRHVGLGHIMLRNTPESEHEKLPLHDSLAGLAITADARIDNRDELLTLLALPKAGTGHITDSSLILLLYKKYGVECVRYLVGDFAFAIWDEREQLLFCVRDHMGVKPFFYYPGKDFLAFASEIKGLLSLPDTSATISKDYFYNHIFPNHIQAADATLYQHIKRLPPATTLSYRPRHNQARLHQYWTLDADTRLSLGNKQAYEEGLRYHFEEAVRCRIRSGYNIGAELSGGTDSSSITGVAAHLLGPDRDRLTTFTNADSEASRSINAARNLSEQQYVDAVLAYNKLTNAVGISQGVADDPIAVADLLLEINDGIEWWKLPWQLPIKAEAQARGIRTMLSGFPGDEMVTYRGEHYFLHYLDQKQYLKYYAAESKYPFKKIKPFFGPGLEFVAHKLLNIMAATGKPAKTTAEVISMPWKYRVKRGDVAWQDDSYRERYKSFRHFQRYRLLKPQVALRMETETRIGAWYGVEPRFPMADIRLTQFYLSMPDELKYEGTASRETWRSAMQQYLPDIVRQRDTKIGSLVPYVAAPRQQQQRLEAMKMLLKRINDQYPGSNKIPLDQQTAAHATFARILLLRWIEKNFESL